MKRVGVLVGREKTFPEAIIQQINDRGRGDVVALLETTKDEVAAQPA